MPRRKKYTYEFKQQAVLLVNKPGVTVKQIAEDLGINAGMLARWRKEAKSRSGKAFVGQGKSRDQEVTSLKRELNRVKKERDFLKEAAVFFAKESE